MYWWQFIVYLHVNNLCFISYSAPCIENCHSCCSALSPYRTMPYSYTCIMYINSINAHCLTCEWTRARRPRDLSMNCQLIPYVQITLCKLYVTWPRRGVVFFILFFFFGRGEGVVKQHAFARVNQSKEVLSRTRPALTLMLLHCSGKNVGKGRGWRQGGAAPSGQAAAEAAADPAGRRLHSNGDCCGAEIIA